MESSIVVQGVPFAEAPRDGQLKVFNLLHDHSRKILTVQLPTGYGKTRVACGCYSILRHQGRVNRLLYIVNTQQQRDQFRSDGPSDFANVGCGDIRHVIDITYDGIRATKAHWNNTAEVFVTTVQSIMGGSSGRSVVEELMSSGEWMIVIDEHHHYGLDKAFSMAVESLPHEFRLAQSATPERPGRDGIFGTPDVIVKYSDAAQVEGAVKSLHLIGYNYRVDTIGPEGEISSFTTTELAEAFGLKSGPNGELTGLDKAIIARNLRWSPKYVSPLVDRPIQRAIANGLASGMPVQVLIRAMSISHAKLVFSQISNMYKDSGLIIEWVGTGEDGKTDEENSRIIAGFCPPKRKEPGYKTARRYPEDVAVNILIAIGLAGEGMDSTYVTEVVFLTPGNDTNQNRQTIGRGARIVKNVKTCNVNVDSSTDLAQFSGSRIMALMDVAVGEIPIADEELGDGEREESPLPVDPLFVILDAELIEVDDGEVRKLGAELERRRGVPYGVGDAAAWNEIPDSDPRFQHVMNLLRDARVKEDELMNEQSITERWHNAVKQATQKVAGAAMRRHQRNGNRVDQSLVGDLKKRINSRKSWDVGPLVKDVEQLKRHYQWLVELDKVLQGGALPLWLE